MHMKIKNFTKIYDDKIIFNKFSIQFKKGQNTVILGPSGCGKTTLLNHIAFNKSNKVSYIFQEPRLLPWYSLEKNLIIVLNNKKKENIDSVGYYLNKVGLYSKRFDYPKQLSGGERQRASIARAFCYKAPVLLMDEPFQSQDIVIKKQLIELVKILQTEEQRTIIAVTHDIQEAATLGDRAIVLSGRPATIILDIDASPDYVSLITKALHDENKALNSAL